MITSDDGKTVIKHFEGLRLVAYPDPKSGGAPWTAMYGATGPDITPQSTWTLPQAEARLSHDLAKVEADVDNAVTVPLTQGQFDAMVSIVFNIGHGSPVKDGIIRLKSAYPSTLLRMLNQTNYLGARGEFIRWVSPGSSVERGLRKRRRAEQALWDGLTGNAAIIIGEATA